MRLLSLLPNFVVGDFEPYEYFLKCCSDEAKQLYPALITHQADVATPQDRINLTNWVIQHHPAVNVLVNNAGVQRQINLVDETENWAERQVCLAFCYCYGVLAITKPGG